MHKFDRIFERYDMDGLRFVNLVENGGEGRRLAAARGARDKDQAGLLLRYFLENWREIQTLEGRNVALEFAHHDGKMALLPKNVYAETRFVV